MYLDHDTDWATSSKGNLWRRIDGKLLIVGQNKTGGFWARVGNEFLKGKYPTEMVAMIVATNEAGAVDDPDWGASL